MVTLVDHSSKKVEKGKAMFRSESSVGALDVHTRHFLASILVSKVTLSGSILILVYCQSIYQMNSTAKKGMRQLKLIHVQRLDRRVSLDFNAKMMCVSPLGVEKGIVEGMISKFHLQLFSTLQVKPRLFET
mmetsp:Transcript_7913/g.7514  ORF Transcript_7913/g.7514 Transcript_7913/m.7514 type:complete len:131 (+) Transcript_7913:867-1259(+)